jgi:hypothetical protein
LDFSAEAFDVIIQGGQSNGEGCGLGPVETPYEPRPEILRMDRGFTIDTAREQIWDEGAVGNFGLSFADRYIKGGQLKPGRKLLILAAAVGGTGFCDKRWGLSDDLFLDMKVMLQKALTLSRANRPVAFLWHQGETDVKYPVRDTHYNNLLALVQDVRKNAGRGDLPFIAGDFVQQWKAENAEVCQPIITAIRDVCADIGYAAFVETDGLTSNDQQLGNGDAIHFSRAALYLLGHRYYDAYCGIKNL